jgi:predicted membrane protein
VPNSEKWYRTYCVPIVIAIVGIALEVAWNGLSEWVRVHLFENNLGFYEEISLFFNMLVFLLTVILLIVTTVYQCKAKKSKARIAELETLIKEYKPIRERVLAEQFLSNQRDKNTL